ncbi:MAG TPA: DUF4249 domain-containing protein [Mucilaginibacter sp.]|nr:DUF4249 domain-containing protein [Mucilaginibacter sp.]
MRIAGITLAVKQRNLLFGNDMEEGADMTIKQLTSVILMGTAIIWGCKKHYTPKAVSATNSYLVVEGVIVAGGDSTIINLSRTVNLASQVTNSPELNATVIVEGDQGVSYTIPAIDSGKYASAALNLDNTHKYRLKINTADGQTYASNYEPVKITPPIDSLWFTINSKGLTINSAAHDPSNNTRYYRWDYSETYVYQSAVESDYIYDPTQTDSLKMVVLRTPAQQIHTCYITLNSSAITINSSAALANDVIANQQITQIADTSEKLTYRYSILLRQYALTDSAFEFWQNMKKNTQQIGTIFDVQPSEISGNIHCTSNPKLPVLGYVSVSSISQKRIFIDPSQLPAWQLPHASCLPITNPICWVKGSPVDPDIVSGVYIPMDTIKSSPCLFPPEPGYSVPGKYYICVDCRYHLQGKTSKPAFWK